MNNVNPEAMVAYGYADTDRKRILSGLQSARDRMASMLPRVYGEAWDGDLDAMLEAINYIKRCKQPVLRVFNTESQNIRLRALLMRLIDIEGPQPGTAEWAEDVRKELRSGGAFMGDGNVSQETLDAGTKALMEFRKSGSDWADKPAHAAQAVIEAVTAKATGERP